MNKLTLLIGISLSLSSLSAKAIKWDDVKKASADMKESIDSKDDAALKKAPNSLEEKYNSFKTGAYTTPKTVF